MGNRFEIVGKIVKPKKDSEYYRIVKGANGTTTLLNFSVKSNNNVINLSLMGYLADNKKDRKIMAYKKVTQKGAKGEKVTFLYDEKNKYLPQLAEFSKTVISDGGDKVEFCHNKDFIEYLHEAIENGHFEGVKVRIKGNVEYSTYTNKNNEEIQGIKYIPTRIYFIYDESVEDMAESNITMYIDDDCVIESEKEGHMTLHGKIEQYSSKVKRKVLFDEYIEFEFEGEKAKLTLDTIKKRLNLDSEDREEGKFNEIGIKVDIIRGSEQIKITEDMLSAEDKLNLELGLMTMEEIEKEKGGGKGEFKQYNKFKGLMKGYSTGAKVTEVSEEDYIVEMIDVNEAFGVEEVVKETEEVELEEIDDDDVPF